MSAGARIRRRRARRARIRAAGGVARRAPPDRCGGASGRVAEILESPRTADVGLA